MADVPEFARQGVAIRKLAALREHNVYAYIPVLHAELEVGRYADERGDAFPGFVERITGWLPGLWRHECSVGKPGGFVERLRRGTYLPHIAEHVCVELQNLMGFDVAFGRARGTGRPGLYDVVVEYEEEMPARAAFHTALRLTLAAMHDEPFDAAAEIDSSGTSRTSAKLGPSTAEIVHAAPGRDILVIRLTPGSSLIQLGYGVHQKRIRASETSRSSAIAVEMCQEKPLANGLLRVVGVPVPDGDTARSADEAWDIAQSIGLPVVVKPYAGNQGKGVGVNHSTEREVRDACAVAHAFDSIVLVERHVEGSDHRLLVVNGRMVVAARREPASVVGDGMRTVEALVAAENRDERRRPGHGNVLTHICLDGAADLALAQQGLDRAAIPPAGQRVLLRTNANLSTGGTASDVTDDVHPRNARVAELAAQILALDVAGVDVVGDTHFAERGRVGRVLGVVAHNPANLGIGIDDGTPPPTSDIAARRRRCA